jgi:enolase
MPPVSRDAQEIANAINKNTRALEKLTSAIEKSGKEGSKVRTAFEGTAQALDLDEPKYDTPR